MENVSAKKTRSAWRWRSLVSFYLLFTAIVLLISGVVLFISPPGRFAHATDWRFLGFDKEQWEAIHTLSGYIGTLFAVWHLALNWKALRSYLKDRICGAYRLKAEFIVALLLTVIVWTGAALHLPPFGTFTDSGEEIKETWEQSEPLLDVFDLPDLPAEELGHEEGGRSGWGQFTVEEMCEQRGIPAADGLARLAAYGLKTDSTTRIRMISDSSGLAPSHVVNIILGLEPAPHAEGE